MSKGEAYYDCAAFICGEEKGKEILEAANEHGKACILSCAELTPDPFAQLGNTITILAGVKFLLIEEKYNKEISLEELHKIFSSRYDKLFSLETHTKMVNTAYQNMRGDFSVDECFFIVGIASDLAQHASATARKEMDKVLNDANNRTLH